MRELFDVQIAHSVTEIGQEAWDRLAAGRPFASYRWYRFGEAVRTSGGDTPVYIVLSQWGEPVACVALWLTKYEPLPTSFGLIQVLWRVLIRRWPALLCESPLASLPGLVLPNNDLRNAALAMLLEAAAEQAHTYRASFLSFGYLPAVLESTWPAGYTMTWFAPGLALDITWANFDDYLTRGLDHKRRKNLRRNMQAAERRGIMVRCVSPTMADVERALPLIRAVEQRHGVPPNPWASRAMECAHLVEAAWLAAEIGSRLVGCELMLGDGDAWLVTALGLDYDVEYAYFALGYADIRQAIERGARVLRWGSGAFETKHRLGFRPEDNRLTISTGCGIFRRLLRLSQALLNN